MTQRVETGFDPKVEGRDLRRSIGEIQALYALRNGTLNGTKADNLAAQG